MGWTFDAGPLHFSDKGMALKPQMKVGYADANVDFTAGLDDVRDGISGGVAGRVHRMYEAEGHNFKEVLKQLKNKSEIRVLDDVVKIAPQLLSQIIAMTKVDIPENSHVTARAILKLGIGITGGICLGWADTKGFHMVGCRGAVSAAASIGGDIMAGLHHSRRYVKAILGISNVCVEMVFELPEKAETGTAGEPGQRVTAEDIEDVVAQGDQQRNELGVEQAVSTAEDARPAGGDEAIDAHAAPATSTAGAGATAPPSASGKSGAGDTAPGVPVGDTSVAGL